MVLPVLDCLLSAGRMSQNDPDQLMLRSRHIDKERFSRKEARNLLFNMVKKTVHGMKLSLQQAPRNMVRWTTGWMKK